MEIEEYQNIFKQEDTHWWYQSLCDLVLNVLDGLLQRDSSPSILLDAGCGPGGILSALSKKFPTLDLFGLDISYHALTYCRKRSLRNLLQASVEHLPFADESFNVVVSTDVFYHLQVGDDEKSLVEIHRILRKEGHVIVHLAAFEFLRSAHDRVVHTRERYKKSQLCKKMEMAGFKIITCTYRHMILFPVLFFRSMIDSFMMNEEVKSDLRVRSNKKFITE